MTFPIIGRFSYTLALSGIKLFIASLFQDQERFPISTLAASVSRWNVYHVVNIERMQ